MATFGMHLISEHRCLFAMLLLTVSLVATACGNGPARQLAIPAVRGRALDVTSQGSLPSRGPSGAVATAPQLQADAISDTGTVIYRVGQTAAAGSLRVTIDRVVGVAGEAGNMPEAGQRFLLVYMTVENSGKEAQALSFFSTSITDAAGRHYFVEPYASSLSGSVPLNALLPPGGRMSGTRADTYCRCTPEI